MSGSGLRRLSWDSGYALPKVVPQDVSEDALQMAGNYTLGEALRWESWYIVSKGEGEMVSET